MSGFVVVGTDTDAGKTAFAAVFLAANLDRFAYWKPVETGESDTETIRRLVPGATVFPPLARFREPVAPPLAAAREGRAMPTVADVLAAVPASPRPLLIETFGGPLSPFGDGVLQAELIAALGLPVVLVTPSAVGAVGRALQAIAGLRGYGVRPAEVVLVGPPDEYAAGEIGRHAGVPVTSAAMPATWDAEGVRRAAEGIGEPRPQGSGWADGSQPLPCGRGSPADLLARDRSAVWHPYTALADPDDPLPVVAAEGEFLHLADGRTLIDGISSWWTTHHGHRHPPLVAALRDAAGRLDHVLFAGATHPPAVELAELLLRSAPGMAGGRVFYSDNGSTAVEVALKMAYQAWCHRGEPGRTLFVGFEHGYHGDTFGAMAAGRDPVFFARFDPLLFRTLRVPVSPERLADALDAHPGRVAAVILEPLLQAAGGMRTHSPDELRAIVSVCRERGVFFIADEVMTGGGRTGTLWACDRAGVAPDLLCAAKTLTGGLMPLAATLASAEVVAAFDTADRTRTFFHGHSYTAHPLACAVAAANWRAMLSEEWRADAERIERTWRERVLPLASRPGVRDVRILGTMAAVEVDAPGGYLAEAGRRMRRAAIERGVLLRPLGDVVYALPPLGTSDLSLGRIADAIEACIGRV
jgi:adenosylmethionine-8-amino-7-oxononanoate aminotransferase